MKIEIIREYILKIVLCYLIFLMSSCQPTKVKYDFIGKQDENPLIGIEGRIFGVQQTTNQLIYLIEIICDKNTLKIFSNTNYIERIGIININGVKFESEIYILSLIHI